jgi:hypothetical protein
MDMRTYAARNFIKLEDVSEGPITKTIAAIEKGNFDKPEATFSDGSTLSLNKTSVLALGKVFGFESDDWVGRRVEIYAGDISYNGTTTSSVLVRPIDAPVPTMQSVGDLNDEDINF